MPEVPKEATRELFETYLAASLAKDVGAMAACWHEDCEGIYPLKPNRGWRGIESFHRVWTLMWEHNPSGRYEVVSTACADDRFVIEARIELPGGTLVPGVNVFDVEDGKIRRVRVYADIPTPDEQSVEEFISA